MFIGEGLIVLVLVVLAASIPPTPPTAL